MFGVGEVFRTGKLSTFDCLILDEMERKQGGNVPNYQGAETSRKDLHRR